MANITCIWCVAWRAVRTVIQTQDNRTRRDITVNEKQRKKQNLVYLWKWPLPHSEKSPALETWLPDSTPS